MERFDVSVGLRAAGVDAALARVELGDGGDEIAFELVAVVAQEPLELPAGVFEIARDAPGEHARLFGGRVALFADHQFSPGKRGADVDRGQLPDRAFGPFQSADVEAVDPDQLTRRLDVDVLLRAWISGRLDRKSVV